MALVTFNGESATSQLNLADNIKTPHNSRLHREIQILKKRVTELTEYQQAHPKPANCATRQEIETEKRVQRELIAREKRLKAQLSTVKTLYRQSVLKVREEKAITADHRAVNDALILGLHNLKYEEQSLRSEIAAAENFELVGRWHVYVCAVLMLSQPQIHQASAHSCQRVSRKIPATRRSFRVCSYESAY